MEKPEEKNLSLVMYRSATNRGKARILLDCLEGDDCKILVQIESQLKVRQDMNT